MDKIKNLSRKLKALGNKRRLMIMEELLKRRRLTVGEISDKIKLSFRSTSRHLKVLRDNDFVDWEQVGISVYYFISPELPNQFLNLIKS